MVLRYFSVRSIIQFESVAFPILTPYSLRSLDILSRGSRFSYFLAMIYPPNDGDRTLPLSRGFLVCAAMIVASVPFFSQFLQLYMYCMCSRTTAFAGMISTSLWIRIVISWSFSPHTGQTCSSSVSTYSVGSAFLSGLRYASFLPFCLPLRIGHAFSGFGSGWEGSASCSASLNRHTCSPSSIRFFSLLWTKRLAWLLLNSSL